MGRHLIAWQPATEYAPPAVPTLPARVAGTFFASLVRRQLRRQTRVAFAAWADFATRSATHAFLVSSAPGAGISRWGLAPPSC